MKGVWFPHDANARNDLKIVQMTAKWKYGYQWYFQTLEIMREEFEYKLPKKMIPALATQLREELETIVEWLADCLKPDIALFQTDGQSVWSESLIARMQKKDHKSEIYARNAHVRWEAGKGANLKIHRKLNGTINEKKPPEESPEFDMFWEMYDKKVGDKTKVKKKFLSLPEAEREKIFETLPRYIASTPDKVYRKHPATYLNNKAWNDEIVIKNEQRNGRLNTTQNFD